MNRTKKVLLQVLMVILCCVVCVLTGCSGKVEGTYKFQKISYQDNGMSMEIEVGEKFMGMITLTEDYVVLTLNEDGSAVMTKGIGENANTTIGSWIKAEEGKIALVFEDEVQLAICKGKTIEIEMGDSKLFLKK